MLRSVDVEAIWQTAGPSSPRRCPSPSPRPCPSSTSQTRVVVLQAFSYCASVVGRFGAVTLDALRR